MMNNTFKALADPTRRKILQMLSEKSLTAGAIAEVFNMTKPSISHHLNVLKAADLVSTERDGQNIIYSLNSSVVQEMIQELMNLFQIGEEDF
jgi:DNA-binding transcriptional ArsR family regulator